jgi:hypothetical protein
MSRPPRNPRNHRTMRGLLVTLEIKRTSILGLIAIA